jgi:hypothetical protein
MISDKINILAQPMCIPEHILNWCHGFDLQVHTKQCCGKPRPEEKVAEDKMTYWDALRGLEASRK